MAELRDTMLNTAGVEPTAGIGGGGLDAGLLAKLIDLLMAQRATESRRQLLDLLGTGGGRSGQNFGQSFSNAYLGGQLRKRLLGGGPIALGGGGAPGFEPPANPVAGGFF